MGVGEVQLLKKITVGEILVKACLCSEFSNFGIFVIHFHTFPIASYTGLSEKILGVLTVQDRRMFFSQLL